MQGAETAPALTALDLTRLRLGVGWQALSTNQVPAAWAALAPHHSLPIGPAAGHRGGGSLPLGQWAKDTAARFAFFRFPIPAPSRSLSSLVRSTVYLVLCLPGVVAGVVYHTRWTARWPEPSSLHCTHD